LPFPSLKAGRLLALLQRFPLSYRVRRQVGSHRILESATGYPQIVFAFHDRETIAPGLVRRILVKQVGLSPEQALAMLEGR